MPATMNVGAQPGIDLSGLFPGASSGLLDIIKQLQNAQTQANTANQTRYDQTLGLLANQGQAGMTRIANAEQQAQAKGTQDLTSRGLGNTTVTSSVNRGIASDAELARQTLQESVAQQKARVMEMKTDQGPDMGLYANLLSAAAQRQQKPRIVMGPGSNSPVGTSLGWNTPSSSGSSMNTVGTGSVSGAVGGGWNMAPTQWDMPEYDSSVDG